MNIQNMSKSAIISLRRDVVLELTDIDYELNGNIRGAEAEKLEVEKDKALDALDAIDAELDYIEKNEDRHERSYGNDNRSNRNRHQGGSRNNRPQRESSYGQNTNNSSSRKHNRGGVSNSGIDDSRYDRDSDRGKDNRSRQNGNSTAPLPFSTSKELKFTPEDIYPYILTSENEERVENVKGKLNRVLYGDGSGDSYTANPVTIAEGEDMLDYLTNGSSVSYTEAESILYSSKTNHEDCETNLLQMLINNESKSFGTRLSPDVIFKSLVVEFYNDISWLLGLYVAPTNVSEYKELMKEFKDVKSTTINKIKNTMSKFCITTKDGTCSVVFKRKSILGLNELDNFITSKIDVNLSYENRKYLLTPDSNTGLYNILSEILNDSCMAEIETLERRYTVTHIEDKILIKVI